MPRHAAIHAPRASAAAAAASSASGLRPRKPDRPKMAEPAPASSSSLPTSEFPLPTSKLPLPTSDTPSAAPAPSSSPSAPSPSSSIQNPLSSVQNPTPLLLAVAACDADAATIAARFNLSLETYLDWLSAPDNARRLSALIAQNEAVRLKRLEARHDSALETLHELHQKAEANADPIERRRAATAVARFSIYSRAQSSNISRLFRGLSFTPPAPPTARADADGAADAQEGGDPSAHPPSHFRHPTSHIPHPTSNRRIRPAFILPTAAAITPPRPDPAHTPAEATSRLLQLLQTCDEPRRGHGLRTLFNHLTPVWQGYVGARNADEFARAPIDAYRTLINHRSAVMHPTRFEQPPEWARKHGPISAHQSFDFVDIDNRKWTATFEFYRPSGQLTTPWLISRVKIAQGSTPPQLPTSPAGEATAGAAEGNDEEADSEPVEQSESENDLTLSPAASDSSSSTPHSALRLPHSPSSGSSLPTSDFPLPTSEIPPPTSDISPQEAPLTAADLAADAARLADLDRPRVRPPPQSRSDLASSAAEHSDHGFRDDHTHRAGRPRARLSGY